ncbi:A disintegrin and metalloproteinase with thrombospondin motifs adt-1-like [Ixodes scapularis]|uniref:A disintegrin and metalloproteinase with thrombospondin motifs adt-1-like n=1 Tax=Ixodes scapularis TaxID=6945 RepID=UPI001A9CD862|nr:A disintegrin and metalloproteinase with thrombospondin motifs adt-1-like [Ixodes scapularis]
MSAFLASVLICAMVAEGLRAGPSAEYVAYPRLLEARGMNGTKLLHINEKITLHLEKSSVLAENLVVSTINGNEQVDTLVDGREVEKDIYRDQSQMAAVSVTEIDGSVEVRGSLGPTLRISPLPLMGRSEDGRIAHKVFEIEDPEEFKTDYIVPSERNIPLRRHPFRPPVNIPDLFLAEVYFVFDEHHSKHFPKESSLLVYAALTIEMINLRYEAMTNPRVRFVLVGVATMTGVNGITEEVVDRDDLRPNTHKKKYMLSQKTLTNLANAVSTNKFRAIADVTVLVTGLDLADYENGKLSNSVLGVAFLGGMCSVNLRAAETEDTPGTHSMVSILVHELGHSLGMVHDGEKPLYSTDAYRNRVCDARDGYTMAPVAHGARNGEWSTCSVEHLRGFLRTVGQACFDTLSAIHYTINMTRLPGAHITKQKLCERTYSNFTGMTVHPDSLNAPECSIWCCPHNYNYRCLPAHLTDGMECQRGFHCVKHRCVRKTTYQPPRPAPPTRYTTRSTTTSTTRRTQRTRRPYWYNLKQDKTNPDSKRTYHSRMNSVQGKVADSLVETARATLPH